MMSIYIYKQINTNIFRSVGRQGGGGGGGRGVRGVHGVHGMRTHPLPQEPQRSARWEIK